MVVDVSELLELLVQVFEGVCPRLPGEPAFKGLVEPFDFALGLWVVRGTVFLRDAQGVELVFESVSSAFPAGEAGGVDHAVIGQRRGRKAVFGSAGQECGDNGGDCDGFEAGAGEQVAGVVIEEVQDFDVRSVGEGPVGEIRLPGFVGLVGFEAVQGGFGAFLRLRGDEPAAVQDPADRRGR